MKESGNAQLIGRHIVTDPRICHGKPTFRGTRVLVSDVLEQVAIGIASIVLNTTELIDTPRLDRRMISIGLTYHKEQSLCNRDRPRSAFLGLASRLTGRSSRGLSRCSRVINVRWRAGWRDLEPR